MNKLIIYIHGQGGNPQEAAHYQPLFPDCDVVGFDYSAQTPWEAEREFLDYFHRMSRPYQAVSIIANSIGAYFAMGALADQPIKRAFLISPIVNMEKLITDMMQWASVTEEVLRERGVIETDFGQTLSWDYLTYVREHPIHWAVPTHILYGGKDNLTSPETISAFSEKIGATLTVMEDGEHWFHTETQMQFLDRWIQSVR